jgi:hypothetical protein
MKILKNYKIHSFKFLSVFLNLIDSTGITLEGPCFTKEFNPVDPFYIGDIYETFLYPKASFLACK